MRRNGTMRHLSVILFFVLLAGPQIQGIAQTKSETRLYGKTVSAADLKSYDKFLKRYPTSVYASDILARKDTLLNISPYTLEDARSIAAPFIGKDAAYVASALRRNAVDRVYALAVSADTLAYQACRVLCLENKGGKWMKVYSYDADDVLPQVKGPETDRKPYVHDSFLMNLDPGNSIMVINCLVEAKDSTAYCSIAYSITDERLVHTSFVGKNAFSESGSDYCIEGYYSYDRNSRDSVYNFLCRRVANNPCLIKVSEDDHYTDEIVRSWSIANAGLCSNQKGKATVLTISRGSLYEQFDKAKEKAVGQKYTAAMFDYRGYTMIVVKVNHSIEYFLAWAEPECANHNTDRLLNSIYFENQNTLVMAYYHGRKFYKIRYNLASKVVSK